ncbi:hypothetical protein C161_13488 [Paenibacillus sp. FSL R5-192]|uniref:AbiU2 domain-containing protein n=1 Tax=Paenibacillus sp. FSL R5-192 TaxID=1226754 RepID=UPI0003E287A0|nr:hypothetical protein [Paenibacillus sp. FSL R5-192]ETT37527.1 hypothetical protein C161_13488 [Paenibacillus sp. FSL R5-192]
MTEHSKEELVGYWNALKDQVISVNASFEIYKVLGLGGHFDAMKAAPAFFTIVMRSLLNNTIIGLSKIYEKKGRSFGNLQNLLFISESNIFYYGLHSTTGSVISENIKKQNMNIIECEQMIKDLMHWRDKAFAHNDKAYLTGIEQLAKDTNFTLSSIRKLIEIAWSIIEANILALTGNKVDIKIPNGLDVNELLEILYDQSSMSG